MDMLTIHIFSPFLPCNHGNGSCIKDVYTYNAIDLLMSPFLPIYCIKDVYTCNHGNG